MIDITVYPACLKCDFPDYHVQCLSETHYTTADEWVTTDNVMKCEHERVCKFIDGQEPIEIGDR